MSWNISKLCLRLSGGLYRYCTKHGVYAYLMDDFGNLVPGNELTALVGPKVEN